MAQTIEILFAKSSSSDIGGTLVIDSGASQTIIGNGDMILNKQHVNVNINGNGDRMLRLESGLIIRIDGALYAPEARSNVLATDVFTRLGYSLIHDDMSYSITNSNLIEKIGVRLWNKLYACDLEYCDGQNFIKLETPDILDVDVLISETAQITDEDMKATYGFCVESKGPNLIGKLIAEHDFVTTSDAAARKATPISPLHDILDYHVILGHVPEQTLRKMVKHGYIKITKFPQTSLDKIKYCQECRTVNAT